MEYKYYLAQLNEKEATLYSFIYNELLNHANAFDIVAPTGVIDRVINSIMLDNPELFWFEGKWKAVFEGDHFRVIPKYKERQNDKKLSEGIDSVVSSVIEKCVGSDVEKIKTVYDWLQTNVQYCYTDNDQTIEGVFLEKKAVCKGIAKAFQLLMNKLDIPSFLIKGTLDGQTSHIWNVVYVNNRFYHVDVAIGYPRFSALFNGMNRNRHYPCFMISDETIGKTHEIYNVQRPRCLEDFDLDQLFFDTLKVPDSFKQYGVFTYLDKGTTCTVLKANGKDSEYALKVIAPDRTAFAYRAACSELEKLVLLKGCKGVVGLVDSFVSAQTKTVYILTNYRKPLTARRREADFETAKHTVKLGVDILNALMECRSKGIYHLDIQPKNIYFDKSGTALLGDFGNAAFDFELGTLKPKRGILAFMAPEVYHEGVYGQASEIYSLGLILYSLLNGAMLPFANGNAAENAIEMRLSGREMPAPRNCADALWKCISKMCAYDVNERFATYEEALFALSSLLPGRS